MKKTITTLLLSLALIVSVNFVPTNQSPNQTVIIYNVFDPGH